MKRAVILLGILIAGFNSYAQKVKYKDLYVLLRARNYEDGSKFLVAFLTQEPDHPNANYQMGLMLEYKLKELDLLKETKAIVQRADSAILYFNKARELIDDKDIRKHDDDYYELFKRRNLRTGKFEVILSDIQLDIEQRVEALNKLKNEVGDVKMRFEKAIASYQSSKENYDALRKGYNDELTLSLGAADSAVQTLEEMVSKYDSSLTNFKKYIILRKTFEGENYKEIKIDLKPIEGFSEDALQEPDFYSQKVNLYNFKSWSIDQQSQIKARKEYMANLIAFDESLDKMSESIRTDSVDLSSQIFGMITSPVLKELKLVDYDSWLMTLLQYKISQLNLGSVWIGWYKEVADSLDVGYQLDHTKKIENQFTGVEKLGKQLKENEMGPFMRRYNRFVKARYKDEAGLLDYIKAQSGIIDEERNKVDQLVTQILHKDKWGWWHQDSISVTINKDSIGYATLYSDSLANRAYVIAGIYYGENTPKLFFGNVPSSRMIDTLYYAPGDIETNLKLDSLETISGKAEGGKYAILYTENTQATLVYATPTKGIEWVAKLEGIVTVPSISITEDNISILQEGREPIVYNLDGSKGTATTQAPSTEN